MNQTPTPRPPVTHFSGGHWQDIDDDSRAKWVTHGAKCGDKAALYFSACWPAVDCPHCLQERITGAPNHG